MKYEYLIVGSGAGGGTLALELSKQKKSVIVLEKGKQQNNIGNLFDGALKFYDLKRFTKMGRKSSGDEVILWRTIMPGGSTVVSCANMIPSHLDELAKFNIKLDKEISEIRNEINIEKDDIKNEADIVKELHRVSINNKTELLPIDKCIDFKKCKRCGLCVYGCKYGAKWSAMQSLRLAVKNGAKVIYGANVLEVNYDNENEKYVEAFISGKKKIFEAEVIIICAGTLGSTAIMHKSGFKNVGKKLWLDTLVNVYGVLPKKEIQPHITMPIIYSEKTSDGHFLLAPYVNRSRLVRFMECGVNGFIPSTKKLVGIMIKTSDDGIGEILENGKIVKKLTQNDIMRIDKGKKIAYTLLEGIGISRQKIFESNIQGAHPGGTLAIGEFVDSNLATTIKNIYVCDASVLPLSTGIPPIMTIIALAKRLAKHLCNN